MQHFSFFRILFFQLRREFDEDVAEINAVQQSSSEIFEDIFNKLNNLGARGKNVLDRLNQKLASDVLPNGNKSTQVKMIKIMGCFIFLGNILLTLSKNILLFEAAKALENWSPCS